MIDQSNIDKMKIAAVLAFSFLALFCVVECLGVGRPGKATETNSCQHVRQVPAKLRSGRHMTPNGLDKYYQKYTEAYDIPVVSSKNVPDDALKRACYVLRFLLAENSAVRQSFYRNSGRVAVIGVDEGTTSIPEHSGLAPWWNQRTRGLGAKQAIPVCSGGEENILCYKYDRYYREDIILHNTAHGVHILGANDTIKGWQDRLMTQYHSAKKSWTDPIRLSSDKSYFAEGVESYFNVNDHAARHKLKQDDPALYSLIKEVFPCGNEYIKRCDSSRALENAQNLMMNCDLTDKVTTETAPIKSDCADDKNNCQYWARNGYCTITPGYMKLHCKKSCGLCNAATDSPTTLLFSTSTTVMENCKDQSMHCQQWSNRGDCTSNPVFMRMYCRKSCGLCKTKTTTTDNPLMSTTGTTVKEIKTIATVSPVTLETTTSTTVTHSMQRDSSSCNLSGRSSSNDGGEYVDDVVVDDDCIDNNARCQEWATKGECTKNPGYMRWSCRKSCGVCKTKTATDSPTTWMTTTATTAKNIKTDCRDSHVKCEPWAKKGECTNNPNYMRSHCRKSCGLCNKETVRPTTGSDCRDSHVKCEPWAKKGECTNNPNYMRSHCRKSCGLCNKETVRPTTGSDCRDKTYLCPQWVKGGECRRIPDYMRQMCPKACNLC